MVDTAFIHTAWAVSASVAGLITAEYVGGSKTDHRVVPAANVLEPEKPIVVLLDHFAPERTDFTSLLKMSAFSLAKQRAAELNTRIVLGHHMAMKGLYGV